MVVFFSAYKIDVKLYFKRKERDEEYQGNSHQFEMGGALGVANIITALLFF